MKKILAFAIAAGMLASCSNEDEPQLQADGVALGVSSASLETVVTKTSTTIVTDGATIGVYRLALNGYAQAYSEFYYDGTATTPAWTIRNTADNIYLNNNDATVCACTPYDVLNANPAAIELTPQVYDPDKDLSYSGLVTTVNNVENRFVFPAMIHAYAQITFAIEKDATYTGTGLVTAISMTGTEIYENAALNITTGTPAYTNGAGSVTLPFTGLNIAALASGDSPVATQSFFMIPATFNAASTMQFEFTVDGKTMRCTIAPTVTPFEDLTALAAGTNYKFTVTIKGTSLIVNSVSVTDWIDETILNPLEPNPVQID